MYIYICGLRVTVEILLKQADFLDVTLDLPTGKFWPYRKPNNDPLYINAKSNHPLTVVKHLPAAISSILESISCNAEEFHRAKPIYEEALRKSGFNGDMKYVDKQSEQRKIRKRNVTWFNPPFNQNVTTNVARQFLSLVDKHFPIHHRYHKLFNRNNVKCSYSCMNNVASIISSYNAKVLAPGPEQASRTCNCRQPQNCPLNGHCLTECVVYKASVSAPNKPARHYYGLTEGPFKTRYNGHTRSFRSESCRRETELSKYVLDLQDQHLDYEVQWSIAQRAAPHKCGTRRCDVRHRVKFRYDKASNAPT